MLAQGLPVCAQSDRPPVETPAIDAQQKANQRIQDMAKGIHTPSHDYVIGRGDSVAVEVFEVPELTREVRVSQTGTIGLPLLPVRLYVAGLTELQAQQKISEVLEANGLVSHPQVMVFVKEKKSKPIAVVGAVQHAMVVQADRPITLVEVLAEAGGILPDAGDVVIVTRRGIGDATPSTSEPPEIGAEDATPIGDPSGGTPASTAPNPDVKPDATVEAVKPVSPDTKAAENQAPPVDKQPEQSASAGTATTATPPQLNNPEPPPNTISVNLAELLERGDTQNNIVLEAGDVVTIPHAGIIYALGAVNRPGGFLATNDRAQLSTLKVLALAGGMTRVAKRGSAVIIRKDADGHQHSIPVDLGRVQKQQIEDVRLMPSDILYVPDSHAKAALYRTGEIALGVGTSLVIYRIGTQ
jgi:polysaccharide export outer membrane protein